MNKPHELIADPAFTLLKGNEWDIHVVTFKLPDSDADSSLPAVAISAVIYECEQAPKVFINDNEGALAHLEELLFVIGNGMAYPEAQGPYAREDIIRMGAESSHDYSGLITFLNTLKAPATVYTEHGFENRTAYLKSLAEDYGVDPSAVFAIANILGETEDFDGLVSALEDIAEGADLGSLDYPADPTRPF